MQKKNFNKPGILILSSKDFGFLIASTTLDSIDGDSKNFKNPISPSEDYINDKRSKNRNFFY